MIDPNENNGKSLDEAKKELSEMHGRPFEVDKTIAQHRAWQEKERLARKKAEEKLEHEHALARARRHELRARDIEATNLALEEKQQRFAEEKRKFDKEKKKEERSTGQKTLRSDEQNENARQR